uniref:Uncharacterized protein n=1 Tax=Macrostomum lignano TaxID=282301 RepID=A0A1I8IV61_9PLAT
MIFTPVPYQADPADYQLDADALPPQHQQQLPQYTAGSQYTRYRSPTVFGTVAAVGFFGMSVGFTLIICSFIVYSSSRVWGSTLGRGGLLLLIAGSGLLTAAALHHFCKEPARRQLLDRLVRIGSSIKLCCRGLRGSCCPAGIAHLVASNGSASSGGGKSATGAAAAAALRLRTRAESTSCSWSAGTRPRLEHRAAHGVPEPAHACLTPIDLTREHRAAHGVPEPAHACLTPTDLTREHRAAHGVPEPAHACLTPTDLTREHRAAHGVPEPAHACLTPTDLTREHRAAHGVPEPAHACLTPTDLTREHRAAHGVPEPAHACLTPTDLTREHRAAHGVPEPAHACLTQLSNEFGQVSEHSQYCRSKTAQLQFEASPLPPGASRRGGIRSLTLSMALASSKPLILWCGLKPPTAAGEGHGNRDSRPPLSTPVGSMPLGVSPLSSSTDSDSSRSTVKTRAILPMARILLRITSLRAAMAFAGD